jgi:hypothetical protein
MEVAEILQGILPKGDTSAAASWGTAAIALAAGNPEPAIALAVAKLLDVFQGPKAPPPRCTAALNPLGIKRKGEGALAKALEQPTKDCAIGDWFWCDYGSKRIPFELPTGLPGDSIAIEAEQRPELFACQETGAPPASSRYPLARWLEVIGSYPLEGLPFNRRSAPARAEAYYVASWAILSPSEAAKRWRLDVEPVIRRAWADGLSGEQRAALESFYRGRFVAGKWTWGDQVVAGRRVEEIPRWVPLEADAAGLAAIYLGLWDRWGMTDRDLELISAINPELGIAAPGTIAKLSKADQSRALAQAVVIAAAKAKGDPGAFEQASKAIEAQARAWGAPLTVEHLQGAIATIGAWFQSVRGTVSTPEQAAKAAAVETRTRLLVPLIAVAGLGILGIVVWVRRRRRR